MNYAVLLAAGEGKRFSFSCSKLFESIQGAPLYAHSLKSFSSHASIDGVVLVIRPEDEALLQAYVKNFSKPILIAHGGATRQESAQKGFEALKASINVDNDALRDDDSLLFHNAANPFVTEQEITEVLTAAQKNGAAFVGHPAVDTIKFVEDSGKIRTLDRSNVWHAQTPQAVRVDLYERALAGKIVGTDEMSLVEAMGVSPVVVQASENNFKITTPKDLAWARAVVGDEKMTHRTGIGLDHHRFDRTHLGLTLGGVHFPDEPRMYARSDGDVMLHALYNAISQALGGGSLGEVADEMAKNGALDSRLYLEQVLETMRAQNFELTQVGFQLEGRAPLIDPLRERLTSHLSKTLGLEPSQIGITATSGEDLTPFGRGEGLQCFAVATLKKVHYGF